LKSGGGTVLKKPFGVLLALSASHTARQTESATIPYVSGRPISTIFVPPSIPPSSGPYGGGTGVSPPKNWFVTKRLMSELPLPLKSATSRSATIGWLATLLLVARIIYGATCGAFAFPWTLIHFHLSLVGVE